MTLAGIGEKLAASHGVRVCPSTVWQPMLCSNNDLYGILGISRAASDEEITKAYKKLAKRCHPDLNPGNKSAEEKFKKVAAANEILGDSEKRGRYDRGEIDANGAEVHERSFYHHYADSDPDFKYHRHRQEGDFIDLSDILSHLNLHKNGWTESAFEMPGRDVHYQIEVDFIDAANGVKERVTLPDGKVLEVGIPSGLRDGQVLRLKGQGMPGLDRAPVGDAYVIVTVRPHKHFRRVGTTST